MPTYEYRCRDCGESLEVVQSFTDDPLTECPACEGPLKKVFAAPGISFKGGGFYKNDSRSGGSGGSGGSSTGTSGSSESSSSSSSSSDTTSDSSSKGADTSGSKAPSSKDKAASSSSSA